MGGAMPNVRLKSMHVQTAAGTIAAVMLGAAVLLVSACGNPVAHVPEFPAANISASTVVPRLPTGQYRLIPLDQISIRFPFHPEREPKATSFPVQPDGNVVLDEIGPIRAAGLTPEELGKAIAERVSDRLRDPQVVVTVVQYAPRRVFVGGEVKQPGPVNIHDGMTPLQAIFDRGGFTPTAQMDSVILIRDAGSENPQIGKLDLTQAMDNAAPERVTLLANDVIYVPMSGIGRADLWVKQHIKDLIPWELFRPPTARDLMFR
ncbi:MAG TPA: polysaccharide biosynthesis/export family protein [candidate division Zixibacteria bacterium]|nr:polysaccharide biosynthesis/export family protein [candidate division Zixibacteria bacterium]